MDHDEGEYRVIAYENQGTLKIDIIYIPEDAQLETETDSLVLPARLGTRLASAVLTELTGVDPLLEDPPATNR